MKASVVGLLLAACVATGAWGHAAAADPQRARTLAGHVDVDVEGATLTIRMHGSPSRKAGVAHLFFALFDGEVPVPVRHLHGFAGHATLTWTPEALALVPLDSEQPWGLAITTRADAGAAWRAQSLVHHVGPEASLTPAHADGVYQQDPPPDPGGTACPGSCGCFVAAGNSCNVACAAPRCASCLCLASLASCTCVSPH